MCSHTCLRWTKDNLSRDEVQGARAIEVGAYDVNGSLRPILEGLGAREYIGTDMRKGPGVDIVCRAENLVERFGPDSFDIVLSSCTFEHVRAWRAALSNIKTICKPNGLIIFIVPSRWPFHAYPNDYWRYDLQDIQNIFIDFETLTLEEIQGDISNQSLALAKFKKPRAFVEKDLSTYRLYSIVTNTRVLAIRDRDFYTWYFMQLVIVYIFNLAPLPRLMKYIIIYSVMGIKLRVIKPLVSWFR